MRSKLSGPIILSRHLDAVMEAEEWTSSDPTCLKNKSKAIDEYVCYLEEVKGPPISGLVVPMALCRALEVEEACHRLPHGHPESGRPMLVIPLLRYELAQAIQESLWDVALFKVSHSSFQASSSDLPPPIPPDML